MPDSPSLILCSTARLARSLRLHHDRRQQSTGLSAWQPLPTLTLKQWLDDVTEQAILSGEVDVATAPQGVLSELQERMLWEQVIEEALANDNAAALFDVPGMAQAAMEAHRLMFEWQLQIPPGGHTEESRQFLSWREHFVQRCRQSGWLEPVRYMAWQLDCLERGQLPLPASIAFAGFDRLGPQEQRLQSLLKQRGVELSHHATLLPRPAEARHAMLETQEAECRAAVAWVAQQLNANPQARLGLVVPELGKLRTRLAALLDEVLHPVTVRPGLVEADRAYDFSLGLPLNTQPVVHTALALLRIFWQQRIEQQDFSVLLLNPYWSASLGEADARAQLDSRMRQWLPQTVSMMRLLKLIERLQDGETPLPISQLLAHLQAGWAVRQAQPRRQLPSLWAAAFEQLLAALQWPGERSISSHEFQAQRAFSRSLQALARLDVFGDMLNGMQALQRLGELCREQIFQPEVSGDPPIQVMGMLEGAAAPLDGLWVMGMNDHVWPPPPRPNPLIPATVQRAAGVPNADSAVQTAFAHILHERLLHTAPLIMFSSAMKDGERQLRPSPVLAGMSLFAGELIKAQTLAEQLAHGEHASLQVLDDHMALAVGEGEHVSGGTGLLKAQAICPAWAYFQYRLGARELKAPVNGLEPAERGTLVHGVLQHFWQGRDFAYLQALGDEGMNVALAEAAQHALEDFAAERDETLSPAFCQLEQERLIKLVSAWLAFEKTREVDFSVLHCERDTKVMIEGVEIRLVVDRIDRLPDGRVLIMDYKTGQKPDIRNWAESRITEPQLPVYAAFSLDDGEVAAVSFAMVRTEEHAFSGIAGEEILPALMTLDDRKARDIFDAERFADWHTLLDHWRESLQAIARELKSGEAAVRVADPAQLRYCEVLPLLRLPERQLQFERLQADERRQQAGATP
jgi:exodeoxyribonuclease-5